MAFQNDDHAGFEAVLRETQDRVRAYIAGLGANGDEVDDLAQEVYIAYYRNQGKRPADVEPMRWLKGMARNLCMNYFRRSKREKARQYNAIADILAQSQSAQSDDLGFEGAFDHLRSCLERVSDKGRRLLKLRYEENLDSKAIAGCTGLNPGAIRMALMRIRSQLHRCLVEKGPAYEC